MKLTALLFRRYPKTQIHSKPGKTSITLPNHIFLGSAQHLPHEYAHIDQYHRFGIIGFINRYLFPQIIAIIPLVFGIILISCGQHIPALISLIALLACLFPWPSKSRLQIELEGYTMDLALRFWTTGSISEEIKAEVVRCLTSWTYYKMCWSKQEATEAVEDLCDRIKNKAFTLEYNNAFKDARSLFE